MLKWNNKFNIEAIYVDIDGVLADLEQCVQDYKLNMDDKPRFFNYMIDNKMFRKLNILEGAKGLLHFLDMLRAEFKIELNILGSIGREDNLTIYEDKKYWLANVLEFEFDNIYLVPGRQAKKLYATKYALLIDDTLSNIEEFKSKEGLAVHYNKARQKDALKEIIKMFVDEDN